MTRFKMVMVAAGIAMTGAQAPAQDDGANEAANAAMAEQIYTSVCKNCHGPTAQGMASFPKLAHRPSAYLAMRLAQYRAEQRVGANSPLMYPIAGDLSDDQIVAVSEYIATAYD